MAITPPGCPGGPGGPLCRPFRSRSWAGGLLMGGTSANGAPAVPVGRPQYRVRNGRPDRGRDAAPACGRAARAWMGWGCWHTVGSWDNRTGFPCAGSRWPAVWPAAGARVRGLSGPLAGSGRIEAPRVSRGGRGAVRVVVWELHSGREHLIFIAAAYRPLVVCGGAENVVIFDARAVSGPPCAVAGVARAFAHRGLGLVWLSFSGRMVDALATGADEGRGNLR
jgi:hypothetical protein